MVPCGCSIARHESDFGSRTQETGQAHWMSDLAIIVPVYNRVEYTNIFIECLKKNTYKAWTLFIVDDGSTDGTGKMLADISTGIDPDAQVPMKDGAIYHINGDGNWWWTKSVNKAVEVALRSGAELILTQNNDVEFPSNYLERMVEAHRIKPNAIVTAPIFDLNTGLCLPDGGGVRRNWITAKDIKLPIVDSRLKDDSSANNCGEVWRELTHCSGRGCLIPEAVFKKTGLYDEKRLPQYAADDDFTYRAAGAGFPVFIYLKTYCLTPAEETGITEFVSRRSWRTFIGYLTNQKSPANIKRRFWITV
ncbi:MAG TPA: glycosyltransferase family 2 protein, partial [Gammaproteobacteria bacterium]|nr:glycosyltransferase family 2 protein [Gammaproteobacteria bacterium]